MRDARSGATITSKAMLSCMTAHSTGEGQMNNLTIAVIAIAVAQALTILLTIGRDREIKKLRELVTQQRLCISEIKGWLLRERIELAQPRRMTPDPTREAPEIKVPEITAPEIVSEITAPEVVLGSKAPKIKALENKVPEPAKTLRDLLATVQPLTTR